MNVTKSGNTAGAAAPMNIDVISSDNSVNIEKTEEGKSVTYDLKVETPPSVLEITSEDNTISIVRDGARVDLSAPSLYNPGESPEGDFITKSGSFFYDTFSRERRTTEKEYEGTVYQPTVGEKSICISSDVEHGSIASGANSHVEGDDNIVTGEKSFVTGEMNAVFSDNVTVHGNMHHVTNASEFALVAGYGNEVQYGWCTAVFGRTNIAGPFSVVLGVDNTAGGSTYSNIIGYNNTVQNGTHHQYIFGKDNVNTDSGYNAHIIGMTNRSAVGNSIMIGYMNNGDNLYSYSTLIGYNNNNNTLSAGGVLIGHDNRDNTLYDGTIIVGQGCQGFTPGGQGIVLGGYARNTYIDVAPLCLAIGNGDYNNPGNCIAADRAGNVKLYGNVLFDVDGVQYSMKQIVEMLNGQTSSLIYMKTVGYDQNEYKKLFNSMKNNHKIIKNVIISNISDDAYTELYVTGWQVDKDSEGNYDSIKFFTNSGPYVLWSDGSFGKKQLPIP